jgi:hypothetical protein
METLDIRTYHKDKTVISSTGLKHLMKSKRHFAHYLITEQESKPEFDFGNAFEILLIDKVKGTKEFHKDCFVLWESQKPNPGADYRNTENREWKARMIDVAGDRYIVSESDYNQMDAMIKACLADKVITAMLQNTEYQESLFWTCPITGLKAKTRPDITKRKLSVILDIKTTKDVEPRSFARDAARYGYFVQAIMQIEGAIHSGYMKDVDDYYWLAVGKDEPYDAVLYRFPKEQWEAVRGEYYRLMEQAKEVLSGDYTDLNMVEGYRGQGDKYGIIDLYAPAWLLVNPEL